MASRNAFVEGHGFSPGGLCSEVENTFSGLWWRRSGTKVVYEGLVQSDR